MTEQPQDERQLDLDDAEQPQESTAAPHAPIADEETVVYTPPRDLAATLENIETSVEDLRDAVAGLARTQQYQEFSAARLVGAVIEALVVGLLLWALSDWAFEAPVAQLFIKLGFALVLQMAALTAFLLARESA